MNKIAILTQQYEIENILRQILGPTYTLITTKSEPKLQELLPMVDLVFLDARSIGLEGVHIAARIKELNAELPILVYLLKDQREIGEKVLELGAYEFLLETDSTETIRRGIEKAVERQQILKELQYTRQSLLKELDKQEQKETTLKTFFQEIFESHLFQHKETVKNFSRILAASRDLDPLVQLSLMVLKDYLNVSRIGILLDEFSAGVFSVRGALGMPEEMARTVRLSVTRGLALHLARDGTIIRKSGVKSRALLAMDPEVKRELDALQSELAVPLFEKGRLLGILVANGKVSGEPFTDVELEFLFSLCSQIAVAVDNARLYSLLNYQKNYTENILAHITSGVITLNSQERIITFNHKAEEILGIPSANVLEKDLRVLPSPISDLLYETLKEGRSYYRHEVKLPHSGRLLGVSTAQLKGQNGEVMGSVMVFADLAAIQKQREMERHREHMDFVNKIAMRSSHELKNCLVSIRTFTQLLPDKYADKEFRTDFYTIVNHEVDRLTSLVENLNFFAQPLEIRLARQGLLPIIDAALALLPKEEARNIVVEKELTLHDSTLDLDLENIKKVFYNIFRNAVQAMPKGGQLKIRACELPDSQPAAREGMAPGILIQVSDTGGGMPPEECEQAFEPFFTTKSRGIGLGLTIVKKIVEAHCGEVKLFSELGKGTTVELVLPRRLLAEHGTPPRESGSSVTYYGATAKNLNR